MDQGPGSHDRALAKQAEKGDWRDNRRVTSPIPGGPTPVIIDKKDGNDPRGGGRFAPPSGYVDPYKNSRAEASRPNRRNDVDSSVSSLGND